MARGRRRSFRSKGIPKSIPTPSNPTSSTSEVPGVYTHKYFSSWSSFLDHLTDTSIIPKSNNTSSRDGTYYFTNTYSLPEAISLSKKGYTDIVPDIMKRVSSIEHLLHKYELEEVLYMDVYSPCGIYDMGSVCSGVPENAVNLTERESDDKNGNTVVVNFDATVSGGNSTTMMINRGSAVTALIYVLELSGYSVQVNCVIQAKDSDNTIKSVVVRVKDDSEPLDLPMLAFQLCHPSTIRRLGFKSLEIDGVKDYSYGLPIRAINGLIGFLATMPKDEVWIPADFPTSNYDTVENATAFIQEKLQEISTRYK